MQHIETVTVGSGGAASITFSAIAADWTDLVVKISARATVTNTQDVYLQFNSDTSASYTMRRLFGSGSGSGFSDAVSTASATGFRVGRATGTNRTANTFSNCEVYIPNYLSTVAKSASSDQVDENNATEAFQLITACLYSGTSAVTEIDLKLLSGNFAEFSTASLYGITAGSDGIVAVS